MKRLKKEKKAFKVVHMSSVFDMHIRRVQAKSLKSRACNTFSASSQIVSLTSVPLSWPSSKSEPKHKKEKGVGPSARKTESRRA